MVFAVWVKAMECAELGYLICPEALALGTLLLLAECSRLSVWVGADPLAGRALS